MSTLAGSGVAGFLEGTGTAARFNGPYGVAVDAAGNVYAADYGNQRIRKITSSGVVGTLAGSGVAGSVEGPGSAARFKNPTGVAVNGAGTTVFVADYGNQRVRRIGAAQTLLAQAGMGGTSAVLVSLPVTGLPASTTYYFRLLASNAVASVQGNILRFTTPAPVSGASWAGTAGSLPGGGADNQRLRPAAVPAVRTSAPLPGLVTAESSTPAKPVVSVTGTGTVNSPVGALGLAPALAGRGEFALNVQWAAGAPAPVGHATWVWVFGASRYEIASTQVSQFVPDPAGRAARIDGACAINGVNGFNFTVIVVRVPDAAGVVTDRLRLPVRDAATATVVLDTQPGTDLDAELKAAGQLTEGRITITGTARD